MLEQIGDALLAVVSGGATGILGSAVQSFTNYKTKQLEGEQEKYRLQHDERMVDLETTKEVTIKEQERQMQNDTNTHNLQMASYTHDARSYMPDSGAPGWIIALLGLVDVLRGLVRPSLTAYSAVAVTMILLKTNEMLDSTQGMTMEQLLPVANNVWTMVLYVSTTIFFWWFGQRPPKAR